MTRRMGKIISGSLILGATVCLPAFAQLPGVDFPEPKKVQENQTLPSIEELQKIYVPQIIPEDSYRHELELISKGIYAYDLPLFDPAWRKRGSQVLSSPAFLETFQKFNHVPTAYLEGKYAVIYYAGRADLGPVFLYQEKGGWVIDRTATEKNILYGESGWIALDGDYPYLELLKKAVNLQTIKSKNPVRVAYKLAPESIKENAGGK